MLSLPDQQAYLIACIDDEIANRIHRLVTDTTPLFPNPGQIPCCYDVIDSLFEEKIPLLLRRVQFIAAKQQEGQDGISWREELRNMADDAAIEDMETADLLCVIYVTGIRNDELSHMSPSKEGRSTTYTSSPASSPPAAPSPPWQEPNPAIPSPLIASRNCEAQCMKKEEKPKEKKMKKDSNKFRKLFSMKSF